MNEQPGTELEMTDTSYWNEQLTALERLEKNKDFQLVIEKGYLKDKALNSMSLLADPGIKKSGQRADVMEDLGAISNLQYHLMMVKQLGEGAREDQSEADLEG